MPARSQIAMTLTAAAVLSGAALVLTTAPATQATNAAIQEDIKPGTFRIDAGHSNVNFRVVYMSSSHFFGRFNDFEGSFLVDPSDVENSYIKLAVMTDSVDTNSERRDSHLTNEDFFFARQFPKATFVSTSAELVDDDTLRFTGDFTLRGVSQEVTVDVDVVGTTQDTRRNATRSGWITTLTFNRSDHNVVYGIPGLSDETELTISITGLQQ